MLTPTLSYQVQSAGTKILLTNTTTFGDGSSDPSRAQSLVNFFITFKPSGGDTELELSYDPALANSILADIYSDGWYRLRVEITKDPDGDWPGEDFSYSVERDIIVKDRLCFCWSEFGRSLFKKKPCGCECSDALVDLYCLEAQIFCGIDELVSQYDFPSAQKAVERLSQECSLLSDCGC